MDTKKLSLLDKISTVTTCSFSIFLIVSFFTEKISIIPFSLWWLCLLGLVILTAQELFSFLKKATINQDCFIIIILLCFYFLILSGVNDPRNIDGESVGQINCTLNNLKKNNFNLWSYCYNAGYPISEFYLLSLPPILFGRIAPVVNWGIATFFILGITVYVVGVYKFFSKDYKDNIVISVILFLLLCFPFFNSRVLRYEQSALPAFFTLLTIGLILLNYKKNSLWHANNLIFSIYLLIFSYTPSLSSVFLFLILTIIYAKYIKTRFQYSTYWYCALALIVVTLIISLIDRNDVSIINAPMPQYNIGHHPLLKRGLEGLKYVFIERDQAFPFTIPYLNYLFLLIIIIFLSGYFGRLYIIFALWICATIFISAAAKTNHTFGTNYAVHKSLNFLPIFITSLLMIWGEKRSQILSFLEQNYYLRIVVFCILIIVPILGINQFIEQSKEKPINNHLIITNEILKYKNEYSQKGKTILIIDSKLEAVKDTRNSSFSFLVSYLLPNNHIMYRANVNDMLNTLNQHSQKNESIVLMTDKNLSSFFNEKKIKVCYSNFIGLLNIKSFWLYGFCE